MTPTVPFPITPSRVLPILMLAALLTLATAAPVLADSGNHGPGAGLYSSDDGHGPGPHLYTPDGGQQPGDGDHGTNPEDHPGDHDSNHDSNHDGDHDGQPGHKPHGDDPDTKGAGLM